MADLVKLTIDGKALEVEPGTLVIDAAKRVGIEVPAFCYWEGLSLQAACRMCLVEVEKAPKLMTACTLPAAEGMVVRTETPQVAQARKSTLEFLLTNHPLDCPVCDAGGECELQDMVFRYGAGESRFQETKYHVEEKQWSPVVFFDRPRCILCFRCVRICDEGLGVRALGIVNRGVTSEIAPNRGDHLECDECGACIDICPVGALNSGIYRYRTRPWEMDHAGTICTHCSNGCKTTLGVRGGTRIIRGNNRDRSGINGEFLCIKGRYAYDFYNHPERLQSPLMRRNGKLEPVSWADALSAVARRFSETKERGGKFAVIGSNHTTNEENYYLQKFARQVLGTGNIDHHRTGDAAALREALQGAPGSLATVSDLYGRKAVLVIGAHLALEQPLLAFTLRANYRHHQARVYVVTEGPVREDKIAAVSVRAERGRELEALESLREPLRGEPELVILFSDAIQGEAVGKLVSFGRSLGIPVQYVCLLDYSNSRGAVDMGLVPGAGGLELDEMKAAQDIDVFWVVGANPFESGRPAAKDAFLVVQDLLPTETVQLADVVLPAASRYEKAGTVTSVTGEVQGFRAAVQVMGAKPDLEIIGLIGKQMGVAAGMGPWSPEAVFEEIRKTVPGYDLPPAVIAAGGAAQAVWSDGAAGGRRRTGTVRSDRNGLFASGTLGRYSKILHSVLESRLDGRS
ncbi:MAG: NADH-quinone oxidoreductase subunit NuoG [Bryobacterales bacterium]|nr:NADH-quinone oxidoreductase subunit NuoG [Bryobacterales bacterium]